VPQAANADAARRAPCVNAGWTVRNPGSPRYLRRGIEEKISRMAARKTVGGGIEENFSLISAEQAVWGRFCDNRGRNFVYFRENHDY
jgi:hypothetical protein